MNAIFLGMEEHIGNVYAAGRMDQVRQRVEALDQIVSKDAYLAGGVDLSSVKYVFSTWGMPNLTEDEIAKMPNLEAIFYAAGSVQNFARPFLNKGIKVFSAWAANAVPVAEFTLAQILLSCKRYFLNAAACKKPERRQKGDLPRGKGIFAEPVALIGAGMIGRKVIELLKPFSLDILVVDPYMPDAAAADLGVTKVSLEDAFKTAYVVSNHLPNLPATKGMLTKEHFASMREGATFINTGRGAQLNEEGMLDVLAERPDLTALLDVTDPEPPLSESRIYTLPNVFLSGHIAGSLGNEVVRMADYMIAEFDSYSRGEPLQYEVTLKMLETMA